MRRKSYRKRVLRTTLFSGNVAILLIVAMFVVHAPRQASAVSYTTSATTAAVNPLDQLSSANIALTIAQTDNLPEATAITNQADTQSANLAMSAMNSTVVAKPQVVATALKSRANIVTYTVGPTDTVASIASNFGITTNSILWSNGLRTANISAGEKLIIPPVTGIVYTVASGDTPQSLAQKFSANVSQIIAYNDAEISGIQPGERILIPNGTEAAPVAPVIQTAASYGGTAFAWGGNAPIYGQNGYDFGYCTWYVASQIAVPNNWGNASSWAYYAAHSGWNVSPVPTVGAIAQTPYAAGGEGHVAIVSAVSADGTQIKFSDMNGIAGWGRVGYSGWEPASTFLNYITH